MSEERDDVAEALLRRQFDGPVRDKGFSERVMQAIPRRRRRATWPLWVGFLTGALACWLALLRSPLLRTGWQEWVNDHWSTSAITVLMVMSSTVMLALVWGVAEADDH